NKYETYNCFLRRYGVTLSLRGCTSVPGIRMEKRMIDWTHVDDLRADMGDAFGEVVEVFLLEVDAAIRRLSPERTAPDLAADLHFLKGAALNLGFRDFATLCATGEASAHAGRTDGIDL